MNLHQAIIKSLLDNPLPISDLQAIAQVSLPTLRKALQELIDARWIRVVGQSEANGGRPAMLFGIDDRYYLVVGLHIQLPGIQLIATDLQGNVLDVAEDFSDVVPRPDQVIQRTQSYIQHIREAFPERLVLGVGVASPGFTDPVSGEILSIERVKGWQNTPICEHLEDLLNLPVTIANDIDCMAFAEFQRAGVSLAQNLAYVGFDEGVKVSMFLNGQLYKGSFGNAGLIVTRLLNLGGEHRFDEQEILTINAINHQFEERLRKLNAADQEAYAAIVETQNHRQRFIRIMEGAAAGLPACQAVVENLNTALAVAVANTIYMLQPDMVIIGGLLTSMPSSLCTQLILDIRHHLPRLFSNRSIIRQSTMSSAYRSGIGANDHFLDRYLSNPSGNLLLHTPSDGQ